MLGRNRLQRPLYDFATGGHIGTFITEIEPWQIGDAFTTGDGRAVRITDIFAPERSSERPAYTDR